MTDYTRLVAALRCCCPQPEETCDGCPYDTAGECNISRMMLDAAAAIEALQAEVDKKEGLIDNALDANADLEAKVEELQQIADHYEQTAKDYWEEACMYRAQLPERGEWLNVTDSYHWYGKCSVCGEEFVVDAYYAGGMNYCPNCGAKMEVQDARMDYHL